MKKHRIISSLLLSICIFHSQAQDQCVEEDNPSFYSLIEKYPEKKLNEKFTAYLEQGYNLLPPKDRCQGIHLLFKYLNPLDSFTRSKVLTKLTYASEKERLDVLKNAFTFLQKRNLSDLHPHAPFNILYLLSSFDPEFRPLLFKSALPYVSQMDEGAVSNLLEDVVHPLIGLPILALDGTYASREIYNQKNREAQKDCLKLFRLSSSFFQNLPQEIIDETIETSDHLAIARILYSVPTDDRKAFMKICMPHINQIPYQDQNLLYRKMYTLGGLIHFAPNEWEQTLKLTLPLLQMPGRIGNIQDIFKELSSISYANRPEIFRVFMNILEPYLDAPHKYIVSAEYVLNALKKMDKYGREAIVNYAKPYFSEHICRLAHILKTFASFHLADLDRVLEIMHPILKNIENGYDKALVLDDLHTIPKWAWTEIVPLAVPLFENLDYHLGGFNNKSIFASLLEINENLRPLFLKTFLPILQSLKADVSRYQAIDALASQNVEKWPAIATLLNKHKQELHNMTDPVFIFHLLGLMELPEQALIIEPLCQFTLEMKSGDVHRFMENTLFSLETDKRYPYLTKALPFYRYFYYNWLYREDIIYRLLEDIPLETAEALIEPFKELFASRDGASTHVLKTLVKLPSAGQKEKALRRLAFMKTQDKEKFQNLIRDKGMLNQYFNSIH